MNKNTITPEEYIKILNAPVGKKASKFGNRLSKTIDENGIATTIDSRKEKYHLTKFRLQMRSNEAVRPIKVESGVWFVLEVNGIVITKYKLDIRVTYNNGMVRHIDVKPTFDNEHRAKVYKRTHAWRMFEIKRKLMFAIHKINIEII